MHLKKSSANGGHFVSASMCFRPVHSSNSFHFEININNNSTGMVIRNHLLSVDYRNEWMNTPRLQEWFVGKGGSVIISASVYENRVYETTLKDWWRFH